MCGALPQCTPQTMVPIRAMVLDRQARTHTRSLLWDYNPFKERAHLSERSSVAFQPARASQQLLLHRIHGKIYMIFMRCAQCRQVSSCWQFKLRTACIEEEHRSSRSKCIKTHSSYVYIIQETGCAIGKIHPAQLPGPSRLST